MTHHVFFRSMFAATIVLALLMLMVFPPAHAQQIHLYGADAPGQTQSKYTYFCTEEHKKEVYYCS